MGQLCRVIYPYADLVVKSNFGCKMTVVANGVPIWDTVVDRRVHHDNSLDLLMRLRRVVEGY